MATAGSEVGNGPVRALVADGRLRATLGRAEAQCFYWGLSNLLYVANFVPFAFGVRRWQLEITNVFVWVLLAYGCGV